MSKIDYQALRERYSPKPVPECSVCGEEMSIQRISGAHVVYACSSYGGDGDFKIGRTLADEHYEKSRITVVDDSDPDVIALLDELEAAKSQLNDQREYYEGVISDGGKRIAELEAREVQLPTRYDLRYGHPINADERHVMIPKENGSWLCLIDLEHALRVAGIRIKGE
ncbi:TPA: ead/Ea22-like family protein [Escherichia coli]|nr:ead/Ea22-like family protein [Escherichia coli]HAW3033626.1 ead/Ea22-like family protein [Escherichia coli]